MNGLTLVDELYSDFCTSLPLAMREHAQALPFLLGLAPRALLPWSAIFNHEMTLAAPLVIADAMPEARPDQIRQATLGHMLAIIEAFGTDRIEDGQVQSTPELVHLLSKVRLARNQAVYALNPSRDETDSDCELAESATATAIAAERELLSSQTGVSFTIYELVSSGKQTVGLPASLALASTAGWNTRKKQALRTMLLDVWLGLQLHDDVVDWQDDERRGGSWVKALASSAQGGGPLWSSSRHLLHFILQSGVLAKLLRRSARHFRRARRIAQGLGARKLSAWAAERERHLTHLAHHERISPGYTDRDRVLSRWARTVGVERAPL